MGVVPNLIVVFVLAEDSMSGMKSHFVRQLTPQAVFLWDWSSNRIIRFWASDLSYLFRRILWRARGGVHTGAFKDWYLVIQFSGSWTIIELIKRWFHGHIRRNNPVMTEKETWTLLTVEGEELGSLTGGNNGLSDFLPRLITADWIKHFTHSSCTSSLCLYWVESEYIEDRGVVVGQAVEMRLTGSTKVTEYYGVHS